MLAKCKLFKYSFGCVCIKKMMKDKLHTDFLTFNVYTMYLASDNRYHYIAQILFFVVISLLFSIYHFTNQC